MNPDISAMRMRNRRPWEALDLGVSMARLWFSPLIIIWLALSLPVIVLVFWLFWDSPQWAPLILWWLKPLWERALLYYVSRAIFDDAPGIIETIKAWPKVILPQCIPSLTWRRLSTTRSMDLPVVQLEGLRGADRTERLRILHDRGGNIASWATVVYLHIEGVVVFSIIAIVAMLIPSEIEFSTLDYLSEDSGRMFQHVLGVTSFIAMSLVAPFYVVSGFSLYLNRRIELEAWDIDLTFRRIVQRRKEPASTHTVLPSIFAGVLLMLLIAGPISVASSFASDNIEGREALSRDMVRQQIDTVLADKRLGKEGSVRVPKVEPQESNFDFSFIEKFFSGLAEILRWLLYIVLAVFIVLLLWKLPAWIGAARAGVKAYRSPKAPPTELFGLDLRPESLPDNVSSAVMTLWESDPRGALALLYRATLARLIYRFHLEIPAGATEGDCELLAMELDNLLLSRVLREVTQYWQMVAYGHRLPDRERMFSLTSLWDEAFADFGEVESDTTKPADESKAA